MSRCLIVEDRPDTLTWLKAVVEAAFPGAEIAQATTLREARAWLDANPEPVKLALIDLGLPDGSGVELVARIAQDPDAMPVVATIYDDDLHLFDSIAAGARGYILKTEETQDVVRCLQRIEQGEPPLSPSIARRILERLRPTIQRAPDPADLTARETEVLTLLARGLTVSEAAASLGLKAQTVAGYVKVIYQKLGVSNRAGAALAAVQRGLT